jgi:4-hydroxy-tetrahydrodipicolinate reductase
MSDSESRSEDLTVAVTGATGRMGGVTLALARERGHGVIAVSRAGGRIDGVEAVADADLAGALAERAPDALIDFTTPEASREYVAACAETGTPAVVGTTGFDASGDEALERAAERIPVLQAPNFSRGVHVLESLAVDAAEALDGYDVELTETHHNGKRDAPSGTAERLLEAIEATGAGGERVHGREGMAPRGPDEIGVHVRRAGDVRGQHELLFAGDDEVLTLSHRAESRRVFAAGALDAAAWLAGRDPGRYEFGEVVGA